MKKSLSATSIRRLLARRGVPKRLRRRRPPTVALDPELTSNGDGTFTLRPGTPVRRMSTLQFARQFHIARNTVYAWIQTGAIDPKFVEAAGKRKILIDARAVADCRQKFRRRLD